jgi:hypothetical protein
VNADKPPFEFGQTVFVVRADSHLQRDVPCPVCYGKLRVTVILGNDEQVSIECDYCTHGIGNRPSGTCHAWGPYSSVTETTVTGMVRKDGGWRIETPVYSPDTHLIFANRDEAEAQRVILHAKAEKDAEAQAWACAQHARKKLAWHVGYHNSQLRRAQFDVEWHGRKVQQLKAKERHVAQPEVQS